MATVDELEWQWTLTTAVARFEELRVRDSLADAEGSDGLHSAVKPLNQHEALELLALGEVIARKVGYGRQLTVRTARAAGASWARIGEALGTSRQAAWEAHDRWIESQARQFAATGYEGLDDAQVAAARTVAGDPGEGRDGDVLADQQRRTSGR